jgi:uncharacterized membrane protein
MGWCPNTGIQPENRIAPVNFDTAEKGSPIAGRGMIFFQLTWLVVGLSYLTAFAFLPFLPETIPVHWNLQGLADGFSYKIPGIFGLVMIITATALFLNILPRFERMKENLESSQDLFQAIIFSTITFLYAIEILILMISIGVVIAMGVMIPTLLGSLFVVLGSLMPYLKRNTTVGFRLPWTLRDDRVWKKTHEHGGRIFLLSGLSIIVASPFAGDWAMLLFLLILCMTTLYISIYSYRLSKIMDREHGGF